jgi:hypothetical protein
LIAPSDRILDRKRRYQGLLPLEILNEMSGFHDAVDKKTDHQAYETDNQYKGMDHPDACKAGPAG